MDIWEIYNNSFDREINSDEMDFLDTMIRKYPYFAMARFLKAKAIPTTYNIGLASAHAPSRPLFKAFMEGKKSVRDIKNRTVMEKRETTIHTELTYSKHELFSVIIPESTPVLVVENLPFSVFIPTDTSSFNGFLDVVIKEKVHKYQQLPHMIQQQIKDYTSQKPPSEPAGKTEDLIQRFLDNNPKIKRPVPGKEKGNAEGFVDKSVHLDEEIVSETLAKIHLRQNNIAEALRIYQKLSLLFPEKSAYFDAQISEITHT